MLKMTIHRTHVTCFLCTATK